MTYAAPSPAGAPVPPHRGRRQPRQIAEGKQGQAVQKEHDGEGEEDASDTSTSANSEDPCPRSYHLYHRLTTYPLEDIRLPSAQRRRVDKALHRQKTKCFNATGNAETLMMLQSSTRPPAAMVGWGATRNSKEKFATCPPKFFDLDTNFGGMSKKNLLDTMRTVVFMSAVRREQERGDFADNAAGQLRRQPRESDPANDTNNLVSPTTAAVKKWQRLVGFPRRADEHAKLTPVVAIVAAAAAAAAAGAVAAASHESEPNPNQHGGPFEPFTAIQRLVRRVRAGRDDGAETGRPGHQWKATYPGMYSSADAKYMLTATFASLGGAGGCRSNQGRFSKAPSLDWTRFIYGDGDEDKPTEHGQEEEKEGEDSMHVVGLADMKQAQLDLAAMKGRAAIAIPRNSSRRKRVANARIDAILYALIRESLRGGGPQGGSRCGSREEEVAEATTAEEGEPSAKHNGRSGATSNVLNNSDVEAVITYVDSDQSGEVDVEEFQAAISAAKRGKIPDTRLADCIGRIDDMLRLKHLRVHDVFRMLDSDDSGKLSRGELTTGLNVLLEHSRAEVIQRRQALRKQKQKHKDEESKKRAKEAGLLTTVDSVWEETVRERNFFATEVTEEHSFGELLRSICEQEEEAERDEDDAAAARDESDSEPEEGGGDPGDGTGRPSECDCRPSSRQVCFCAADDGGAGSSRPQTAAQHQVLQGRRHRKKKKKKKKGTKTRMDPIVGFRAQHAHLNQLRDEVLTRRKFAAAAAAAAAAASDSTTSPAAEEAAAVSSGPEGDEEETEENLLAAKSMDKDSCSDSGIDGGGTCCDETSENVGDQDNVDVLDGVGGRGAGDEVDGGGRAGGPDDIVDVGGLVVASSGGVDSEVASGCIGGSDGRMNLPLIMRICGEESRGEQRVEFPATFHEHDGSPSDKKSQGPSLRLGARDDKGADGGGNASGLRLPPPPSSVARVRGSVKGTRDTGVGEDVVEKQRQYALSDRYLRVYLQRRFEQERLPKLFASRSSKSTIHRYTVTNPYEMARKQAAQIPRFV